MDERIQKDNLNVVVTVRLSRRLFLKLKGSADMYAEGDRSSWIRYLIDSYAPKLITPKRKRAKRSP